MSVLICWLPDVKDWLLLLISFVLSVIWSLILFFYLLKPKLSIQIDEDGYEPIKIKIFNKGKSSLLNIKIEACFVNSKNEKSNKITTIHLAIDKEDFLSISSKEDRTFKTNKIAESVTKYKDYYDNDFVNNVILNNVYFLRVRVYAQHEFSGFGRGFEAKFKYNGSRFELIN